MNAVVGALRRLGAMWNGHWFAQVTPLRLGIGRAVFLGALFFHYRLVDFSEWGDVTPLLGSPRSIIRWLPVPDVPSLEALQVGWKALLAVGCVGLFARPAVALAFIVGLYLLTLQNSFVAPLKHEDLAAVFGLGVLAASPCADAFSVDRLLFGRPTRIGAYRKAGLYGWAPRLLCAYVALVFFAAGVSKLRHGGIGWITSTNLARWLAYLQHPATGASYEDPLTRWGAHLTGLGPMMNVIAALIVCVELLYPLSIFSRRARRVLVPASLAMLACFRLLFGPCFAVLIFCSSFWLPWDRLAAQTTRLAGRLAAHLGARVSRAGARRSLALGGAAAIFVAGWSAPYAQTFLYVTLLSSSLLALLVSLTGRRRRNPALSALTIAGSAGPRARFGT
jgi:hypothetical protein